MNQWGLVSRTIKYTVHTKNKGLVSKKLNGNSIIFDKLNLSMTKMAYIPKNFNPLLNHLT